MESSPPQESPVPAKPPEPPASPSQAPEPGSDRLSRLGLAGAGGVLAGLAAGFPSALRGASHGASIFITTLVATALLAPVGFAILYGWKPAQRGFRGAIGVPLGRRFALTVALWVGVSAPLLAALGAGLKAATNHRGLGGATFGVLGCAAAVGAFLLARRAAAYVDQRADPEGGLRGWYAGGFFAALALALVAVAPLFSKAPETGAGFVLAALLDLAISVVVLALLASFKPATGLLKAVRVAGVPLLALVCIGGVAVAEQSRANAEAMRRGGGLAASLLGALERWTDRDEDGYGAHFGGGDCDEGDPTTHPAQVDTPGDGRDADCDGVDGPVQLADAAVADAAAAPAPPETEPARAEPEDGEPTADVAAAAASLPSKPHIVLVTLDTVRADRTSAYGYEKDTTPNLTALAADGLRFDRAYAPASDTQRCLMPLISGVRLSRTERSSGRWPGIDGDVKTLAERMKDVGYRTGAVTSFTWLRRDKAFDQGFDEFEEAFTDAHPERKATGKHAVRRAKKVLEAFAGSDEPTFLWVHLFDAHDEYLAHDGIDFGTSKSGLYDGEIRYVDDRLGEIVEAVRASGRFDQTVWIIHGSHGEGFAEHDFFGHGREIYDEVIRVPFVVAGPGVHKGVITDTAVGTVDIAPTLLAIAGAPIEGTEGVSLRDTLASGSIEREPLYIRAPRRGAMIDFPLKLMVVERDDKAPRLILFDLKADPGEEHDVASDRPEDLLRLKGLYEQHEQDDA